MIIEKIGMLSSFHLNKKTAEALCDDAFWPKVYAYGDGNFVRVPDGEEDFEPCPHDLDRVLRLARKDGVSWIKIDGDADLDPRLPVYDWFTDGSLTVCEAISQTGWNMDCDMILDCKAIDAAVRFISSDGVEDETEFTIKAFDAGELQTLFEDFCIENGFNCNLVESVTVTATYAVEPEEVGV